MSKQQSSSLLMALAIIAVTMLVSTVVVETLDLFDDAESKKGEKKWKNARLVAALVLEETNRF
jgi:hypothetical protein